MMELRIAQSQPGSLYQDAGKSTAYRVIKLIDPETGAEVTVRIEADLQSVDAAFSWVAKRIGQCCAGGPQWGHAWDCPSLP